MTDERDLQAEIERARTEIAELRLVIEGLRQGQEMMMSTITDLMTAKKGPSISRSSSSTQGDTG